jgi:O-antigen biosynthesis protein
LGNNLSSKRYEPPSINLEDNKNLYKISIDLVGDHKKIFEIGSSTGYVSKILKKYGNTVTGIEIDKEAGQIAKQYCDQLIIGDVELIDLDRFLEPASFDVILCGDVLEHLKSPSTLLEKIKKYLKPDGYLVVSLPNFCHGDVLLNIFNGDFHYTSKGLLDETHLHFFGLKNIYSLFAGCGYEIKNIHTTNLGIGETELKVNPDKIPQELLHFIRSLPNSDVYQFVFTAYPSANVTIPPFFEPDMHKLISDSFEESVKEIRSALSQVIEKNQTIEHELARLNHELVLRDNHIQTIESDITRQHHELILRDNHIQTIESDITRQHHELILRDNHIQTIESELTRQHHELILKNNNINNLDAIISDREKQISEVTPYTRRLEQEISAKNRHIYDLTNQYNAVKFDNNLMVQSITYQMTNKFHHAFIDRVFPQNSRRRKLYDRGLKLGRIVINNGWKDGIKIVKKYQTDKKNPDIHTGNTGETEPVTVKEKPESSSDHSETGLNDKLRIFLSDTNSRLVFPDHAVPVVSIIILTYNKSSYTYQCLQSILKYTDVPYELIIVDNGSTDNTSELLAKIDNSILIKNKDNLGFIKGCNEGAKKATGKYLLFLNNDTVVTEKWLSTLVITIETYPKCGGVGCKLVWPNGLLQEAGSIIWRDGSALGYGRNDKPDKPEYSYVREIDYCSGACLLVRKDLFFLLKGFDEQYIPAYYEDSDLCLGIQDLGYSIIYQPDVTVFHHEFTSSSRELAEKCMVSNQVKFLEKWGGYLPLKKSPSLDNVIYARDVRKGKKILFLDDRIPASDQGSGYPRANKILSYLGELGYKVTFYPLDNTTPWQPYTHEFQQSGIEIFYGGLPDFLSFARQRSGYYDIIFVSRPHNFEKTYDIIRSFFPDSKLIYDAEALFSIREILKAKVEGINLNQQQVKDLQNKEIMLMKKANLITTVSEKEKEIILQITGLNNIFVLGHPITIQEKINGFGSRKDILFVGGFLAADGPNDDAVIYFLQEIWPRLQKDLACKFYIVGINPPEKIKKFSSESVIITGYVQDLQEYYNKCRVFVVPHRYAAGIPWKLQEAMSYGIPAVVSELIASQLNLNDCNETLVARDPEEFIKKVRLLYENEKLWIQIQQNSIDYIATECKPDKIKNNLENILEQIP